MNEVEKSKHIAQKYKDSKRVYTIFKREKGKNGFIFTIIFGHDDKKKVKEYVETKEKEGKKLIVYCARPQEKVSSCVYTTEDDEDV